MVDRTEVDEFELRIGELESTLGGAGEVAAAFSAEVSRMQSALQATGRDADALSRGLSRGVRSAFEGVVFDGKSLKDALGALAQSLSGMAYSAAIRPAASQLGGLIAGGISGLFGGAFSSGGSFAQGRIMPFAAGGVVSGPTQFPMRGGWGLMGEAGPEAIMPLTRGADGRLGVRSEGGARPVQVVMNVTTRDAESFQRSRGQIAAQFTRALSAGQRNT